MRNVNNAKQDKELSDKRLATVSAVSADSDSAEKISLKTKKDIKDQYKKAEKIKHHYFRTFYYSFAISFIILGSLAVLYFMYQQDKNVFGFSDRYYEQALAHIESGNYSDAENELLECLALDPDHAEARLALVNLYDNRARYDDAIAVLTEGIEISPRNETYYEKKIQILTKTNRISDAMDFVGTISSTYIIVKLSETRPSTVVMTPDPGTYDDAVSVYLISSNNATVYYTLDGSAPTTQSLVYDQNNPPKIEKGTVTIRAFAMNANGMISDEYKATYRIYSENSAYIFLDDKVEQMVRTSLNKQSGTIYYRDLQSVKRLSNEEKGDVKYTGAIMTLGDVIEMVNLNEITILNEPNIKDFTPLQQLKSLTSLNVSGCLIDDATAKQLFSILWLNTLKLDDNLISNIENVKNMSVLRDFSAANNSIKDLTPLENLSSLRSLNVANNLITDIDMLSELTSLRTLNISNNLISDISSLSYLTMLTELDIGTNDIKQLNAISRLPNVENLTISNNPIQYLSPISEYTKLITLKIDGTAVTTLGALSNLLQLATLDCSRTLIADFSSLASMNVKNLILSQAGLSSPAAISTANSVQILDLSLNSITDVSTLAYMTNIKALNISNNPVTNISYLQYCTTLESLSCAGVPISSAEEAIFVNMGVTLVK